jgi:RNA polymerase sigma-70 factor (ECF subfamily)
LTEALQAISPNHRLVLILRYVDDLQVADVAKEIGRSVRATESMLARARTALNTAYQAVDDV